MSGSRDERITTIAEAQRGYVARRQLLAAGVPSRAIESAIATQRLHRRHRGVYRLGPDIAVPLGAETAALLAIREGARLGHHTAGRLCGLRLPACPEIHVIVLGGPAAAIEGIRVHRTSVMPPDHARMSHGLPVTSPARALIDVAPDLTDRQLEFAADHAITERLIRPSELRRALEILTHAPGRSRVLALLNAETHASVTRSQAEEHLLAAIRAARLAEPLVNTRLASYEVDFYWPEARLAVEVDGLEFHATRPRLERDRRKDEDLRSFGASTLRFTARQVKKDTLAVLVQIAQALARAQQS